MPRAIWTGAISFGLVNVPVRLYSAIDTTDLEFTLLHAKDDGPIGYRKVCKKDHKAVSEDEIVKGYEVSKGKYVHVTDDDFAAAEVEGYRTIAIEEFVPYEDIDPIYFERTYYVGPQDGAERVYALLRRAMEDSGLAGIARYVMRNREHLGCLRVREGVITLEKMYFADEIRPIDEIDPGTVSVGKKELEMASDLIDRFTGTWKPGRYRDTYRDRLLKVIRAKGKGKEVHVEPVPEREPPGDILEALRESVEAAKKRRRKAPAARSRSSSKTRRPSKTRKRKSATSRR
jgi:DNA end-binding protein Ku